MLGVAQSAVRMLHGNCFRNKFPLVGIYKETKNRSSKKAAEAYLKKRNGHSSSSSSSSSSSVSARSVQASTLTSPSKSVYAAIADLNISSPADNDLETANGTLSDQTGTRKQQMCRMAVSQLHRLIDQYWKFRLQEAPEFATMCAIHDYDDQLSSVSLAALERRYNRCNEMIAELSKIDLRRLPPNDRVHWRLLRADLDSYTSGWDWRFHSVANAVNFMENIPFDFKTFLIDAMRFETVEDFGRYTSRLRGIKVQVDEEIALMTEAISRGTTQHACSVENAVQEFEAVLNDSVEDTFFFTPYSDQLTQLTNLTDDDRQKIVDEGKSAIETCILPAFHKMVEFLRSKYLPNTRTTYGVGGLKDGQDFYAACLRWHLTINIDPKDVHEIGLQEVARIQTQMKLAMKETGFDGRLAHFMELLKRDSRFYHGSSEELLAEYENIMHNVIEPRLPELFADIPPAEVEVVSFDGQGAQYIPMSADGKRPGQFQINLQQPETQPRFLMMAVTLHETNPGHHLQYSYATSRHLPEFRKFRDYRRIFSAPLLFPVYTAYDEGWALYSEYLGEELSIYRDAYELFGRHSEEMLRAVRLVVDTGLHMFNWSHDEATAYMSANTCLSPGDIEEEVNRYLTWPGQACAYKIGELKIKQLRQEAESRLGDDFDVKQFHELILGLGASPLCVLEAEVRDWIEETLRPSEESSDDESH